MADRDLNIRISARNATGRAVRAVLKSLNSVKTRALAVTAAVAGAFSVNSLAGFLRESISAAADLEKQIDIVATISRASAEEQRRLQKAAEQAGATTKFTALEAAQALENLVRSGKSAAEAVGLLPKVLALAAAEQLQLAESASFITSTLAQYNLAVADAGRVTDILVAGSQNADTNVRQLGAALAKAGGLAADAGLSLEQTVAILGTFANNALRGEEAGTALRGLLSQLSNPASEASRELAQLGDTSGDLVSVLRTLRDAGPAARKAITAFGTEAGPGLSAALKLSNAQFDELLSNIERSGGLAGKAARDVSNNLIGAFAGLNSAVAAVKTALGQPILASLSVEVRRLTADIRAFVSDGSATQLGQQLADIFKAGVTQLRTFLKTFDIKQTISNAIALFEDFGRKAQKTFGAVQVAGGVLLVVFKSIQLAVATLAVLIIAPFVAIAAALQGLLKNLDKVGQVLNALPANVAGPLRGLRDLFKELGPDTDALDSFVRDLENKAQFVRDLATNTGNQLKKNSQGLVDSGALILRGLEQMTGTAPPAGDAMAAAFEKAGDGAAAADKKIKDVNQAIADGAVELQKIEGVVPVYEAVKTEAELAAESQAKLNKEFAQLGKKSADEITNELKVVRDAFENIRDSGVASAEDVQRAYQVYIQRVADALPALSAEQRKQELAAVAASAAVAQLAPSYAQALTGAQTLTQQQQALQATAEAAASAVRSIGSISAPFDNSVESVKAVTEQISAADEKTQSFGRSAQAAGNDVEEIGEKAKETGKAFGSPLNNILKLGRAIASVALGTNKYRDAQREVTAEGRKFAALRDFYAELEASTKRLGQALTPIGRFYQRLNSLGRRFFEQRTDVESLTASLREMAETGIVDQGRLQQAITRVRHGFELLDDENLNGLRSAIDAVIDRVGYLRESTAELLRDFQDDLDRLNGDELARVRRQNAEEAAAAQQLLREAIDAGDAEAIRNAQRAAEVQRRLAARRLEDTRAQAKANAEAERAARARDQAEQRRDGERRQRELATIAEISDAREAAHQRDLARVDERVAAEKRAASEISTFGLGRTAGGQGGAAGEGSAGLLTGDNIRYLGQELDRVRQLGGR